VSSWLAGGAAVDGGVLIPAKPRRHAADLLLSPSGVTLTARGTSAHLPWSDARPSAAWGPTIPAGGWMVSSYTAGRSGPLGVAIAIGEDVIERARDVLDATRTLRNRLIRPSAGEPTVIPLWALGSVRRRNDADRETTMALCAVLADRPELRARLGEPDRAEHLAADLAHRARRCRSEHLGVKRTTMEVLTAMRLLGLAPRYYGRPIPGDVLPPTGELVDRVLERIHANRYARDVGVDREMAERVIARHVLAVEPWPFEALVQSAAAPGVLR
jgi:hypothetical protein